MNWKNILCVVLAFAILFVVVFKIGTDTKWDLTLILRMVQALQNNPLPDPFGGHSFSGGFVEGSQALAYLVTYPLAFLWWFIQQIITVFTYLGGGDPFQGAHAGGGIFNSGGFGGGNV